MKNKFTVSFLFLMLSFGLITSVPADDIKIQKAFNTGQENFCITQDKDGLLWIGTEGDGVYCYNGNELKKTRITKNEELFQIVSSIFTDSQGIIWFSITKYGLYSYDKKTGICNEFRFKPGSSDSLTSDRFNWLPGNIAEDKDGLIWIGTADGLNSFDKKNGKFTQYKHSDNPNSISDNCIWVVFVDSKGLIWIGTEDGLNSYNKTTNSFSCYKHDLNDPHSISDNYVRAITEDKKGNLWIGTKNTGIDKFDSETGIFTNYKHDINNPNSLSYNEIHHIAVDRNNNLWICNEGGNGIDRYSNTTGTFKHYNYDPDNSNGLGSNNILHSFEDNSGVIWLVNASLGWINKCTLGKDIFKNYSYNPKATSSISSDDLAKIYEDRKGNIWIGTYKGGMCLYTKDGRFEVCRTPGISVISFLDASDSELWLGVYEDNSVYLFDTNEKRVIKSFKNPYSKTYPCYLTRDNKNPDIIWFASFFESGLFSLNTVSGKFTEYMHNPNNIDSISDKNTFSIFQDGDILWVATCGDGLTKFDKITGKCTYYKHDPNDKDSISGNIVVESFIDSKSRFWVTTEDGALNMFDRQTGKFTSYGVDRGFPSKTTRHILEDKEGCLWISTDSGIVRFDPEALKVVKRFTTADGLPSNDFEDMCNAIKDSEGNFWFSTYGGLCKFNPEEARKIESNHHIPSIVLSSFKSKEGTYNEDGIKKLTDVKLSWPDNSFSFTFAALDYMDPGKNQYAYKLEGFDKDWNYIGTNNFGQYSNLNPREYTLHLKGSNNDGIWNEEGISIKITITPPFWMTSWFKWLVGIFILSIIGGVVHLRIRFLKKKAVYMRDHAIAEVTAQVSHDIRSPLAALSIASKYLSKLSEQERILIRDATRRISDIANNLLTKYKLKEGEEEKHLKTELVSSIFEHLISEKRFQIMEQSIELVLELGDNTHNCFVNLEPGKFKRTISNLINNAAEAIHHANGIVKLTLEKELHTLVIKIIDNGKGIPEDILSRIKQGRISVGKKGGFGLGISSAVQNIKSWSGSYDIQSKVGEGTTFIIKIPIAEAPDWFQGSIKLSSSTHLVVLDDDESIHNVWQTHFQRYIANKSVTLDHFYEPLAFTEYCKTSRSENDLFLVDYELINSKETGLDLIEQLDLRKQAILVTSRHEEPEIRERIKILRIKIIPKSFAPYIPISII